jgi:hypothetical protein
MASIEFSGLLVQPVAHRVREWFLAGKIDEGQLERGLTFAARAYVDHEIAGRDWAPISDVEGLVGLAADQLGGETGLVDWAEEIVQGWTLEGPIEALIASARRIVDGPGLVACRASELLLRTSGWQYEGGRESFCVRLQGVEQASPALKALLGATLGRLAAAGDSREFDVRFDGLDGGELVIFGEVEAADVAAAESRLHRAALIP